MSGLWSGYVPHFKSFCCSNSINHNHKLKHLLNRRWIYYMNRKYLSQVSHEGKENYSNHTPFLEMLNMRRQQAKHSILVQIQSSKSFQDLRAYCSALGTVENMFHYKVGIEPMHFMVVEFNSEANVRAILSSSSHLGDNQIVPVCSSFLWFKATKKKLPELKSTKGGGVLSTENGTDLVKTSEFNERLRKAKDVSEQMKILYDMTKLNEIGTRLRFLTAKQVEESLVGMFPFATALPFGSSVNGFGKMGCDLDLVLRLSDDKKAKDVSRLIFHCKASSGSERSISQRHMEAVGDLLQLFLPGCAQVRKILQARVPIIKYHQQLTDVECDLSMGNMSGVHMSDFLYLMGSIDERVKPLVFTVRRWAAEVGLTNSSPGRWITNFSITLLVLAFLQKPLNTPPVLPSLNTLTKLAGPEDKYVTEDGINCSFLRDIRKLKFKTENKEPLESLLKQFLEFYSEFDFSQKAVSLNEGTSIVKPEHSALYIVNPLEKGLNVSKNVSLEEVVRFKNELRNAAWLLESEENVTADWGILSLIKNGKKPSLPMNYLTQSKMTRIVDITDIFDESEEQSQPDVHFKNQQIKKQIQEIKDQTKEIIKTLEPDGLKMKRKHKNQR